MWVDMIKIHQDTVRRALKAGVRIAFGTDAGGFDWKIDPAKEFGLMVKYGMTPAQALRSATMTAADCWACRTGSARWKRARMPTSSRCPAIR